MIGVHGNRFVVCGVAILLFLVGSAEAGPRDAALREILEAFLRHPPRGLTREMAEAVADDILRLAARHGDALVVEACEKVGPQLLVRMVREAGKEAGDQVVLKLAARYGDNAMWLVRSPKRLAIFVKYGDEAAEALVRHGSVVEPLIEQYGPRMSRAATQLSSQNVRRLAMLDREGILQKMPHREEILDVIARYGDKAADWVWRNKGALLVTSVAAAFVANPEPFLNGTAQIVGAAAQPVVQASGISRVVAGFIVVCGLVALWIVGRRVSRVMRRFVRRNENESSWQASAGDSPSVDG
ncbi:hypothetical protein [Thermogutta sp.]|uniref:hypothetical protein n=1 Tax=Thermogutta sp. TaxID=1962930 RepID=UPI0032209EEE